jgi:hypothetical protein
VGHSRRFCRDRAPTNRTHLSSVSVFNEDRKVARVDMATPLVLNEPMPHSLRGAAKYRYRSDYTFEANVFRRRRASSAASAKSQSRKVVIFGFIEIDLGQTIQYVLDNLKPTSNGLTSRPPRRSQATSVLYAQARRPVRQPQHRSACLLGLEPYRETVRHPQHRRHLTTATRRWPTFMRKFKAG